MSEISNMASKGWFGIAGEKLEDTLVGKPNKTKAAAQNAADQVKKEAEQKALLEQQEEESKKAKRASLSAQPTSGFGANPNLARSFLSTL
jgi:hypothetical protein